MIIVEMPTEKAHVSLCVILAHCVLHLLYAFFFLFFLFSFFASFLFTFFNFFLLHSMFPCTCAQCSVVRHVGACHLSHIL